MTKSTATKRETAMHDVNLLPVNPEMPMPEQRDLLKRRLSSASEIKITVTGRKSGRPITVPIWFVLDGDTLYLLPVTGSDTQWYKNVLENPKIRIEAGGVQRELKAVPITQAAEVEAVVEKFREKYDSKFDVAVLAHL
jgi:deazaflavin-dependent oxidoreductase (nitroreductase family)